MDLTLKLPLVSAIFAGVPVADDTMYFKIRTRTLHSLKMTVFWDVAPCSLVEIEQRFRGTYCLSLHAIVLVMEAVSTSETSVSFYHTTRRNIPEDGHLHAITLMKEASLLKRRSVSTRIHGAASQKTVIFMRSS
jgi:hypothetical protein